MSDTAFPWQAAGATGIGSLPGDSSREAARIIRGELADLLHVPELPVRGPGADMIGRVGALLVEVSEDFGLETTPDGWRLARGRNRSMRRARSWLEEDLDAIEEFAEGYAGPVKTQITGPWTMSAAVELPSGERLLRDPAACRDLADALGEAIRLHLADMKRRFPRSALIVQVDEPGLPAVLAGTIGTASGMSRYRAVEGQVAQVGLHAVLAAIADSNALPGVHCCAKNPPIPLLVSSGSQFVSVDLLGGEVSDEDLGAAWEAGIGILAGSIPTDRRVSDTEASRPVREAASRLGLADPRNLAGVVITPTCGLATSTPAAAVAAYAACRAAGRVLRDDRGTGAGKARTGSRDGDDER